MKRKCLYPKCKTLLNSYNRTRVCLAHTKQFTDWFEKQREQVHDARKRIYTKPIVRRTKEEKVRLIGLNIKSKNLFKKYGVGYKITRGLYFQ